MQKSLGMCKKVCSDGGATYFIGELIAKDNLNIENLMQTIGNLFLQNCSTKFLDIAHKKVLGYLQFKLVQMVVPPTLFAN